MPTYKKADTIVAVPKELIRVLQNNAPTNIWQTEKEKLTELATIFNKVATTMPNLEANLSISSLNTTSIHLRVDIM